jgi:thiamine pyrophosphokinase
MGTSSSGAGPTSPGFASASPTAVVFAGGDPPPPHAFDDLPADVFVVAADSGVEHAFAAGLHVDLLIGDLDSARPDHVRDALAAGTEVVRHPEEKDATDLELALDAVAARGHLGERVLVVGIHGGRADHLLANALLLASPRYARLRMHGHLGDADVTVVRDEAALPGPAGRICSLLPVGGPANGVATAGLRYPLTGETLEPGSTRGVSNVVVQVPATVALSSGVLLAVLPDLPSSPSSPSSPTSQES